MDKRRSKWHKFVSQLRGTHSYNPSSVIQFRNISSSSTAVDVSFSGRYSRFGRDTDRSRPRLPLAPNSNWSFTNPLSRLPSGRSFVGFTPKCLSGFNFQTILSGQTPYDDFSQNCWLENHLHRFGGLIVDEVATENTNHGTDSEIHAQVPSENENDTSVSQNAISVRRAVSIWNNRSMSGNSFSSSSSSFVSSTVSAITLSCIAGFAFDQDSTFTGAPPPYSEINNDPPPPYTEIPNSRAGGSRNNRRGDTSHQEQNFHDILW